MVTDVSPRAGWLHGTVDAPTKEVSTDLRKQHFNVAHTSFGAGGVRKKCAQGGVSSVACFFSQLTTVATWWNLFAVAEPCA